MVFLVSTDPVGKPLRYSNDSWRIQSGRYRIRAATSAIYPDLRAEAQLRAESLPAGSITPRPSPAVPR